MTAKCIFNIQVVRISTTRVNKLENLNKVSLITVGMLIMHVGLS